MAAPKFTATLACALVQSIANGKTRKAACAEASITDRVLRAWIARGDSGEEPFKTFAEGITRAEESHRRKVVRTAAALINGALDASAA